jgi:hypothetical protein
MKGAVLIRCSVLAVLIVSSEAALAQNASSPQSSHSNINPVPALVSQTARLSPGAQEMANELKVAPLLDRLARLPDADRCGATPSLEALTLRQAVSDRVLGASLEIDGTFAGIDNELGAIDAVRNELEDRRDRVLKINNIAAIIAGGFGGVVATALQFKDSTTQAGNVVGVGAGAVSTFLSVLGLRQQVGGRQALGSRTNMLAKLFGRTPKQHSDYPEEVWTYLNAKPPTEAGPESRIERLKSDWVKAGRIDSDPSKTSRKIDLITDTSSTPQKLSIGSLNDRSAMLADVRLRISLMKRDLSKLLLATRCQ